MITAGNLMVAEINALAGSGQQIPNHKEIKEQTIDYALGLYKAQQTDDDIPF